MPKLQEKNKLAPHFTIHNEFVAYLDAKIIGDHYSLFSFPLNESSLAATFSFFGGTVIEIPCN